MSNMERFIRTKEGAGKYTRNCSQERQHGVVEGIMWDRTLKKQLSVKCLGACVVPACVYGLITLELTERQEEELQVG